MKTHIEETVSYFFEIQIIKEIYKHATKRVGFCCGYEEEENAFNGHSVAIHSDLVFLIRIGHRHR